MTDEPAPCVVCHKRPGWNHGRCWDCIEDACRRFSRPVSKGERSSTHARGSSEVDGDNPWGDLATRKLEEAQ